MESLLKNSVFSTGSVVEFYSDTPAYMSFLTFVLGGFDDEEITIPHVHTNGSEDISIFNPIPASNVRLKLEKNPVKIPDDVLEFIGEDTFSSIKGILTKFGIPNIPIYSVSSLSVSKSSVLVKVRKTFLHHAFATHRVPDLKLGGYSLRDVLKTELVYSRDDISKSILINPLRADVVFKTSEGSIVVFNRETIFPNGEKVISPFSFYPSWQYGKGTSMTLRELIKEGIHWNVPEGLFRKGDVYLYGITRDFTYLGEPVFHVIIDTDYSLKELKKRVKEVSPLIVNIQKIKRSVSQFKRMKFEIYKVLSDGLRVLVDSGVRMSPDVMCLLYTGE